METVHLRVNAPEVIHETIDGEVVIINLATGTYYSVKGSGADVWDVIQRSPGSAPSEIVAGVARRFGRPVSELEQDVNQFLRQLREEGLIANGDARADDRSPMSPGAVTDADATRSFEPPLLEKYTDMQDLVLLDPVHEVDATGWPQRQPEDPKTGSAA